MPRLAGKYSFSRQKQEKLFCRRIAAQVGKHPLQQGQRFLLVFAGHADSQAEIVADQAVILQAGQFCGRDAP